MLLAGRGIGKAVARELGREGVDVAIVARGREALAATAKELASETGQRCLPITADTGNEESVQGMVQQAAPALGHLDILVNCAARVGGGPAPGLSDITEELVSEVVPKALTSFVQNDIGCQQRHW